MKTNIADILKAKRAQLKLSQADVAVMSGIDRSQYSGYEAELREPTLASLVKLSRVLMFNIYDISIRGEETVFLSRGGM